MGLKDRLFGGRKENPGLQIQDEQALEEYVQNSVISLRIQAEQGRANLAGSTQQLASDLRPFAREFTLRLTQSTLRRGTREQFEEDLIANVLKEIPDPAKRRTMQLKSLEAARQHWKDLLSAPDNQTSVIMEGRTRITRITGKIDELAGQDSA